MKENKFDLHVHSTHSFDGRATISQIMKHAKGIVNGIAITDHDNVSGLKEANVEARKNGLIFIPGVELTTPSGDILLLGITEMPNVETIEELEDFVKDNNGIMAIAHPFAGPVPAKHFVEIPSVLKRFHAIEVYNAFTPLEANLKAMMFAKEHKMTAIAASDAHKLELIGKAYTIADASSTEELIKAIKKGRVKVGW
ncbi:MAG: CehA/McbA family metallohydrolase [Candidatus Aenigmarchaeota archaeon]|nr:CehA/McbA family metallohydrolase [Candidatus Aenigmarchaeota archaeon]